MGAVQIGFIAADMNDPSGDLPRVINMAMSIALTGFVLMNISLFMVSPFEQIREKAFVAVVCPLRCLCAHCDMLAQWLTYFRISVLKYSA